MAQPHGAYRLDYNPNRGIIITSPGGVEQDFPVIPSPHESPFTPFHYDPQAPHLRTLEQGTTLDNFTSTQKLIRMWDMIKDGTTPMRPGIEALMSPTNPVPSFQHFAEIRKELVGLTNISAKITKSSWITPNEYETEHNKLSLRAAYQESGLSPKDIIDTPTYVINIANTVIDPFRRDFSDPRMNKTYFPGAGNSVEITTAFFNFMGFSDCSLVDNQITDGITEAAHNYRLQVSPNIMITNHIIPPPPYVHEKGWYAGNPLKNGNFMGKDENVQRALLNVKECGDVDQVFLMFIAVYTIMQGSIHTMVTCDSVVFMMCIMLGLDCVYYHHSSRVGNNAHGENHIYHFNARYTLENAKTYFTTTRDAIKAHNTELMASITRIKNLRIGIFMSTHALVSGFHFCDKFLDDILADMAAINATLDDDELNPNDLIEDDPDDETKITTLNNYTFHLKLYYKIKVLFTTRPQRNGVNFSGIYSKYTEKPTPRVLKDVNIIQPAIHINDEAVSNHMAVANDSDDENKLDGNIFSPEPQWNLNGYDRRTPFYERYVKHYVSTGDCMHPTERKRVRAKTLAAAAAAEEEWFRQLTSGQKNRGRSPLRSATVRNRSRGGVIPSSRKISPKKSPSSHKKSHSKSPSTRKKGHSKSPTKWDIFDLDMDQEVMYTEKTSACKDHNKSRQCTKLSNMPDSDFFPPVNIHKEWIGDILLFISKFCDKTKGAREIFNMYKQEFFREMYEHCDNYNVVLTGKALDNLTRNKIKGIIRIHHTYIIPAIANKASIQKPITYKVSPNMEMFKKYLSQYQQIKSKGRTPTRLAIESQFRPAITAGGRRTRKRSKNTARHTRRVARRYITT